MEHTLWIGTSNRGFSVYAIEELRRLFADARFRQLQPSEVFLADISLPFAEVIEALRENQPVFLRHWQPVSAEAGLSGGESDIGAIREGIAGMLDVDRRVEGARAAVQVRKREGAQLSFTPLQVKEAVDELLAAEYGVIPVVRDADWIVTVYMTESVAYLGISRPWENLSDWPGGAMRFQREEGQISRAKFKLLEAERVFSLDYSRFREALDIGAAPGGWTSLLLDRGLRVTAVDPADLAPELLDHPRLTYLQKNADAVTFEPEQFDLLVCDMSWSPRKMSKLVSDLLYALQSGGTAVITLKLMHGKPFQAISETEEALKPQLRLLRAKQLFHNREELTLYFTKN